MIGLSHCLSTSPTIFSSSKKKKVPERNNWRPQKPHIQSHLSQHPHKNLPIIGLKGKLFQSEPVLGQGLGTEIQFHPHLPLPVPRVLTFFGYPGILSTLFLISEFLPPLSSPFLLAHYPFSSLILASLYCLILLQGERLIFWFQHHGQSHWVGSSTAGICASGD